jgi:hypothetical protein
MNSVRLPRLPDNLPQSLTIPSKINIANKNIDSKKNGKE